jgi:hypothetical protein
MEEKEYTEPETSINIKQISQQYKRVRNDNRHRDARMAQVTSIREGRISEVAPDIFPTVGAWQEPIVANMIDIAARDISEMIAPLPSFNCTSPSMVSEKAREKASLKTKIALGYLAHSDMQTRMYTYADWLATYGFLPFIVECDYDNMMPIARGINPVGTYYERDRTGNIAKFYQVKTAHRDTLMIEYPEHASKLRKKDWRESDDIEVIFYHDKDWDLAFVNSQEPFIIDKSPNKLGKVMINVAARSSVTDVTRGQFDDVVFLQLAKSSFALLQMQLAHDSVNAPIIVPTDVPDVPLGNGAIIHTNNPAGVGRMPIDIPSSAFAEQATLDRELQFGSRFPQVRTGNLDASVVTGTGVNALMGGYESQIVAYQAILARTLQKTVSLMFELDEVVFGDVKKTLRGSNHGSPFEISYTPSKQLAGDYTVDVRYGLMAGLNPNQAIIFGLQARAEKLISRDLLRRELPLDIDVEEEARKVDVEDLEEAAKMSIMQLSQSIPELAAQGQDPSDIIAKIAKVIDDRRKGKSFVDSLVDLFPVPEPQPTPEAAGAPMGPEGMMGGMGIPPEGMMPSEGLTGAPEGMPAEGGAPAEGEIPELESLLAQLTGGGGQV